MAGEKQSRRTYAEDLNLSLDLRHAYRGVNITPPDEFDGNLFSPLDVQPELDLAELALSEGLEKQIWAEFGDCTTGMRCSIGHCGGVGVYVAMT